MRPDSGKDWGEKKINTFLDVIECPTRCGALPVWEGSSWEEECLAVGTGQGGAGVIPLRDACPVCALHPQLTWAGPWCVPWAALVAMWLPRHLLCGGCTPVGATALRSQAGPAGLLPSAQEPSEELVALHWLLLCLL